MSFGRCRWSDYDLSLQLQRDCARTVLTTLQTTASRHSHWRIFGTRTWDSSPSFCYKLCKVIFCYTLPNKLSRRFFSVIRSLLLATLRGRAKEYKMSEIRNVALLSHSGAGKTSLVEAMLYRAKLKGSLGSIDNGTTSSDYTPEEQQRKISIYTTVHPLTWNGHAFNILDTPGYADFVGDIRGAQMAADGAIIVVSAVSGVAVGTERVWASSEERELNRMIVINKMDRENADFFRTMSDIETTLPGNIAAIQVPIGQAENFKGIVDLLHMQAYAWPKGDPEKIDMPSEVAGLAKEYRNKLVEAIVETDNELMEQYLSDVEIENEKLLEAFYSAVRRNELTPVLLTSATQVMGISLLLEFMTNGVRFVEDHKPLPTVYGSAPKLGSDGPFSARVFKTMIDPYMGKVTMMRVLSGSIKTGDVLQDSSSHNGSTNASPEVRAAHLYVPHGKDLKEVQELKAGMIGAVTKADFFQTGDTLCTKEQVFELVPIPFPEPVMALALFPKTRSDDDKLMSGLQKLLDEDPTLRLERNAETHETVLWGMGHIHLEVALQKLKDRYHVDVDTATPKITYRETIKGKGDARYRHKKQSGGAGQFAEVALRVEPLPRGSGFEFGNAVVGGTIPTQFIPSCEKGIRSALEKGILGGFQVVDIKATVYDGKDHPVDSKDIAFQTAAAHAFTEAVQQAQPCLLEPIALVKVYVPDRFTGDIISDLNVRRGRILGMDSEGTVSVVSAHVPMAELQNYSADLRSKTGGRGTFSLKFEHYAEVPQHLVERILAERKKAA
jgi:elongation factor G